MGVGQRRRRKGREGRKKRMGRKESKEEGTEGGRKGKKEVSLSFVSGKLKVQSVKLRALRAHVHSYYDNWHINYHLIIIAQGGRVQADLYCEPS